MIQQMTNRQLAQEINARIGNAPIPFDSVYSIALQIYQELGGEENDFDSVYSILLEILPLAESVAKKTSITEVDELPEANDNNNIYRLSSDDKVYMSTHVSTEYTNRLPDEQQIDKAFLYLADDEPFYYKGTWKFILNDGELSGYGWLETYPDSDDWYLTLTQDNAVNATIDTKCFMISYDDANVSIDLDAHTATIDSSVSVYKWEAASSLYEEQNLYPVPAIYNAPETGCIGNATCIDAAEEYTGVYTGELISFEYGGEQITGYKWEIEGESDYCLASTKPASEIYAVPTYQGKYNYVSNTKLFVIDMSIPEEWVIESTAFFELYIPQLNAPDSEQVGKAYISKQDTGDYIYEGIVNAEFTDGILALHYWKDASWDDAFFSLPSQTDFYSNTLKTTEYDSMDLWKQEDGSWKSNNTSVNQALALLNPAEIEFELKGLVKYQRTIKNWEWKQIPTMDDIPQTTKIKLEDIGGTEMNKLNGFTETGVYNNVDIKVKIDGDYYPGLLTVTVLHSYSLQPQKIDIWQEIRIFGYADTYMVEDWVVQRVSYDGVWDAAQIILVSHSAD